MASSYQEINNKSKAELKIMLSEQHELLRELNFKDANRQLKNVRQLRKIKRIIAQILTVLNQKKDEPSK